MDLRAFLYKLVLWVAILFSNNSFAEINPNNVPYEIKFADVTFQLNEVSRYLVQTEMKAIQSNRESFQWQLDRFSTFVPVVEPMLQFENVPDDFKYLVLYDKYQASVEQTTKVEAGVLWCLNKTMAEDVDLVVNQQIDERKHLIAATKGASICFKRNNILYKNWAVTLYAHLADKKVLNLLEITKKWSQNQYILIEGPAYTAIIQFLAYKLAIESSFPVFKSNSQKIVYEYPYSKGKTIPKVATELKVEPQTLVEYNQWLSAKSVPDSPCNLLVVVPIERYNEIRTLAELTQKINLPAKDLGFPILKRETRPNTDKEGIFYIANGIKAVQAEMCDNFVTLAYKADISLKKFLDYNDLKEKDLVHIGRVYYLAEKEEKASIPFHVVRQDETLWEISQTYGVKLANLLDYNRLDGPQRLQRGRVVWLQKKRPKDKPIEYVELPDDFQEIEEVMGTENQLISLNDEPESEKEEKKTESTSEIDINTLPLTQEIRKEDSKNLTLQNNVDNKQVSNISEPSVDEKNTIESNNEDDSNVKIEKPKFLYHTIRSEETLFRISENYKVSVDDLKKLNDLKGSRVEVGTVLKIKKL